MMKDTKVESHHSKQDSPQFFNGFLVGLILGFGLALLFTTKKGRRMIKALTEEGLDSIQELRKRMDSIEVMMDEDIDEDYVKEVPALKNGEAKKEVKTQKTSEVQEEELEDDEEADKRGSKRKLFRGIGRKN